MTKDDFIPLLRVSTEHPDIFMGVMAYAADPETLVFLMANEGAECAIDLPANSLWKLGAKLTEIAMKQMGVSGDKALLN